ncbi:AsmA family protein [Aristophania vespae]|uniref:AsmA family protein n=1 Tax=Aristophania vespae TaxID=2697033 RepID=A0A6P1NCQ0_9PROT|nr:AsmA family protein [Aristophania vespae]QHI95229.1 AsmA family protein [Aristophania vespae]
MKKLLGGLLGLLLAFIAISVGAHFLADQDTIRKQVVQAVKQQTGLNLTMEKATFQLLPWPSFHAEDVRLARPIVLLLLQHDWFMLICLS